MAAREGGVHLGGSIEKRDSESEIRNQKLRNERARDLGSGVVTY